jgi:hypothetical protein
MEAHDTVGTDGTDPGPPPPFRMEVRERLEALTEGVATANMRTRRMADEVAALRYVVMFALCLATMFFILYTRKGVTRP